MTNGIHRRIMIINQAVMSRICILMLVLISSRVSAAVFVTTNDIGCVLHCNQPSSVFVSGEPVSLRLEFENRGSSAIFFRHPVDAIVTGFHIASRNTGRAIPLTALGKQWDLQSLLLSTSRYPFSLDSSRTMTWDCPVTLIFDLSLPGDYSLDIDIPMRKTMKTEDSVSHLLLSNIVFHINEPTNAIVTFPKP